MNPRDICLQARHLGLQLRTDGDRLAISPKGACPPDFLEVLKAHKPALLAWLRGGDDYWRDKPLPQFDLPQDYFTTFPKVTGPRPESRPTTKPKGGTETAWLVVAEQILAGEFDDADSSVREALIIGLRSNPH